METVETVTISKPAETKPVSNQIGRDVLTSLINLSEACSKDVTRFHLNCVQISDGLAIACDGHIMAWLKSPEFDGLNCAISATDLKLFKKSTYVTVSQNTISDGQVSVALNEFTKSCHSMHKTLKKLDEKLTIEKGNETQIVVSRAIGLNPELISRLGKALSVKKAHGFKLVMGPDNLSPLNVIYQDNWSGVIMPMRI